MSNTGPSSSDIEHDVEEHRTHIDETLNELRDRFSPEAAVEYGVNYMRGPGGNRILAAARDNPLAVVMALAGIGWLFYTANRPEERRTRMDADRRRYPPPAVPDNVRYPTSASHTEPGRTTGAASGRVTPVPGAAGLRDVGQTDRGLDRHGATTKTVADAPAGTATRPAGMGPAGTGSAGVTRPDPLHDHTKPSVTESVAGSHSTGSSTRTASEAGSRVTTGRQAGSVTGMMGDGTEEQNLGQPGNPSSRVTRDEVEDAFGKKKDHSA